MDLSITENWIDKAPALCKARAEKVSRYTNNLSEAFNARWDGDKRRWRSWVEAAGVDQQTNSRASGTNLLAG